MSHAAGVGRPGGGDLALLEVPELVMRRARPDADEAAVRGEQGPVPRRGPVGPDHRDLGPVGQSMDVERPVVSQDDVTIRLDGEGRPPHGQFRHRPGLHGADVVEGQGRDHLVAELGQVLGRRADLAGDPRRVGEDPQPLEPAPGPARVAQVPGLEPLRPAQLGLARRSAARALLEVGLGLLLLGRDRVALPAERPGRRHRADHQHARPAPPPAGSAAPAPGCAATSARPAPASTAAASGSAGPRRTGPAPRPARPRRRIGRPGPSRSPSARSSPGRGGCAGRSRGAASAPRGGSRG